MDGVALSSADPIFVFATDEGGRHGNALAQLAVSRWGAVRQCGKGISGNSYAIPVQTRSGEKFARERLQAEAEEFKQFARENSERQFILSRLGCDELGFSDAKMAPLLAECGVNVTEPGKWLRRRDPRHCVIAIVGSLKSDHQPSIAWALEMMAGFSGKPSGYVVSDDDGADQVALGVLTAQGANVRVETIDREIYGGRAVAIRNRMLALPATHVLVMDSGSDAKCAHMRKTAAAEGLEIYEMKIAMSVAATRDPELAKRSLEEIRRLAEAGAASTSRAPGPGAT
jgi:hypothetical protein